MQHRNSCMNCKHLLTGMTCLAFMDGIPPEIWKGDNPHTEAVDGDQGIRYEPIDPEGGPDAG